MSHRRLFIALASLCVTSSTALAAEPASHATVALESGGTLRAEVHPTSADAETVILKAPGLLIELPKKAVDEATPADPLQVEYADRAAKAADTAADHFALAAWCKEKNLDPERQYELERTIVFDPDHAEARKALGYTLTGGKWIHPEQSMIEAGYVRYQGSWRSKDELERILAQEKAEAIQNGYVRDMANWKRQVLRGGAQGQEAVLDFQRVTDPAAVFALRKLVTGEKEVVAMREIYVDSLGRIPGGEADGVLVHVALNDPVESVWARAVDRLVQRQANHVVPMLVSQLYGENNGLTNRAAIVLGRLQDRRATSALIDVLVTSQKRTITTGSPGGIGTSFGSGPGNSVGGISAGSSTRTEIVTIRNGEVLGALNAITGQNYGYDQDLWRRWYSDARNVKNVNLRELPR